MEDKGVISEKEFLEKEDSSVDADLEDDAEFFECKSKMDQVNSNGMLAASPQSLRRSLIQVPSFLSPKNSKFVDFCPNLLIRNKSENALIMLLKKNDAVFSLAHDLGLDESTK